NKSEYTILTKFRSSKEILKRYNENVFYQCIILDNESNYENESHIGNYRIYSTHQTVMEAKYRKSENALILSFICGIIALTFSILFFVFKNVRLKTFILLFVFSALLSIVVAVFDVLIRTNGFMSMH